MMRRIVASIVCFFLFSVEWLKESGSFFLSLKPSATQGKSSPKFQLNRINRVGGVREQTNKQTDRKTY